MAELVSVIIPVYNVEAYLQECIESVLCQTYEALQIILVDDGSTDSSGKICDEYALRDARIEVIHQINGGLSHARNVGLASAKGKYVYFLDSDDYILPFAVELLYSKCECHKCDFAFFDADVFGDNYMTKEYYHRKNIYSHISGGTQMLNELLANREYRTCVPMMFFNREFLKQSSLGFKNGILYEDELFTFMAFVKGKNVLHVPFRLYQRRFHQNSIITGKTKPHNFESILVVIKEISEFSQNMGKEAGSAGECVLNSLARSAFSKYFSMSLSDRAKCRVSYKWLVWFCKQHKFFDSISLRINANSFLRLAFQAVRGLVRTFKLQKLARKLMSVTKPNHPKAECFQSTRKSIWVIGTPIHGNLGDHAIAIAEMDLLNQFMPDYELHEILMPQYLAGKNELKKAVGPDDIIVISGGGWLGTLWLHNEIVVREIVDAFKNNKVVIFPQTVYYENSEFGKKELDISRKIYQSHHQLYFCLRDKKSYDFVQQNHLVADCSKCYYMPDVAMTLNWSEHTSDRNGVLLCFRHDREKVMPENDRWLIEKAVGNLNLDVTYTTTVYTKNIPVSERHKEVSHKLRQYSSAKLVITDRLHSMIFAAITRTPCIAFDNKTNKVGGVYEWLKNHDYIKVVKNANDAVVLLEEMISLSQNIYCSQKYICEFEKLFSDIK